MYLLSISLSFLLILFSRFSSSSSQSSETQNETSPFLQISCNIFSTRSIFSSSLCRALSYSSISSSSESCSLAFSTFSSASIASQGGCSSFLIRCQFLDSIPQFVLLLLKTSHKCFKVNPDFAILLITKLAKINHYFRLDSIFFCFQVNVNNVRLFNLNMKGRMKSPLNNQAKKNKESSGSIENFIVQSKRFIDSISQTLYEKFPKSQEEDKVGPNVFILNGINYFQDENVIDDSVQVLEDCVSMKGDYFYLKKGEKLRIKGIIGSYSCVSYHGFTGYFPSSYFKVLKPTEI